MKKKPPSIKRGRTRAVSPSSPRTVAPPKPRQPAGTTESLHKKARQLTSRNRRVFKGFCCAVYHVVTSTVNGIMYSVAFTILAVVRVITATIKGLAWFAAKHPDRIIELAFLLYMEYRVHAMSVIVH